jgi:hypothetical protein
VRRKLSFLLALGAATALGAPAAQAAGAPEVTATWVSTVGTSTANLRAEVDPNGISTTYRFEYATEAAFLAKGFTGALKAPVGSEPGIGSGEDPVAVVQHVGALSPGGSYRYRVIATNNADTSTGPTRRLRTDEATTAFALPDSRGWEMVSPIDKNGGAIALPEALLGGGVLQAAAQGGAVTYGSAVSFGTAQGASVASQYLSRRGPVGWSTENMTPPALSGSYPGDPDSGVPYRLFSTDLTGALLSNGRRCRGEATQCPVANPPLAGSGAPAGYRDYYLRNGSDGTSKALLTIADVAEASLDASHFEVSFAGATPDLGQVILASCAALTANSTEAPGSGGECDPAKQNLYLWSPGAALRLVNVSPGASLAQAGAISTDGSRVYWTDGTSLYLREGSDTVQVDESVGGGGSFQAASTNGSIAYFTKAEHLYRYDAASETATDLTPGGEVQGVLGASADGSYLYYLTAAGLFLRHGAGVTPVASSADASNYPPATGTARVSADGTHLAFLSLEELTDYDNAGLTEAYLYSAASNSLLCASCNPSGERPVGPSTIPAAIANGAETAVYKPRVLSASGNRLFFESEDVFVTQDSNGEPDVYQWEASGTGSCATAGGCIAPISSGRAESAAVFLDASADGNDAFFLTDGSLAPQDPDAFDVYDARVGGGLPVPELPIPCVGDACQSVPGPPEDATPGTIASRPQGNSALSFPKTKQPNKQKHHKKHHSKGKHKDHGKGKKGARR